MPFPLEGYFEEQRFKEARGSVGNELWVSLLMVIDCCSTELLMVQLVLITEYLVSN